MRSLMAEHATNRYARSRDPFFAEGCEYDRPPKYRGRKKRPRSAAVPSSRTSRAGPSNAPRSTSGGDSRMTERFVCLVDDDDSVRESLPVLLRVLGFGVRSFASATEFLHSPVVEATECLILDVAMPGM